DELDRHVGGVRRRHQPEAREAQRVRAPRAAPRPGDETHASMKLPGHVRTDFKGRARAQGRGCPCHSRSGLPERQREPRSTCTRGTVDHFFNVVTTSSIKPYALASSAVMKLSRSVSCAILSTGWSVCFA